MTNKKVFDKNDNDFSSFIPDFLEAKKRIIKLEKDIIISNKRNKILKRKLSNYNNSIYLIIFGIIKFISNIYKFSLNLRNILIQSAYENNIVDAEVYNKIKENKNHLYSNTNLSNYYDYATLLITIFWTFCLLISCDNVGPITRSVFNLIFTISEYLVNLFCLYSSMLFFDYFLALK